MIRRLLTTMMLCLGLLGAVTATAHAAGGSPPARCFNRLGPNGELPTCTYNGTRWVVSYDGPAGLTGQGAASGIMVLALIGVVAAIGVTVWRLSLARRMATESGLDPDRATAMTLLSDDGLDATYLASSLRRSSSTDQSAQRPGRGAEDRLRELQQLRDDGLITAEEYDARRTAIIDAI